MAITYMIESAPDIDQVIAVYDSSGIHRPTADKKRITQMYANANLVVTARDGEILIAVARALTDFCYCCYLSDLAVRKEYQKQGIGNNLIRMIRDHIGPQTTLLLVSAAGATGFYPKMGFQKEERAYIIKRTS